MDFNDLGYAVTVAYEDLSDVWPVIADALHARVPLRKVTLTNKLGATVVVDSLPLKLLPALDPALQRLQQYRHSAVAWFRRPAASIVLLSCNDAEDYRRNFRLQLRAMIDPENRHPLDPEPVFVYVAPPAAATAEADARGAARVVDAMRRELGSRARERIVRIDAFPASSSSGNAGPMAAAAAGAITVNAPAGIEDLVTALKAAVAASIEARISSYGEVVRRHLALLQAGAPTATFPDFYLIKDALAVMLEGSGLVEDAVREYYELEVAHQQAEDLVMRRRRSGSGGGDGGAVIGVSAYFGAPPRGADEAMGIWAGWRASRLAVQAGDAAAAPLPPLAVKQALFANQARVLLKLNRHVEVLDRGLSFLQSCYAALAVQESAAAGPVGLKEAWTFAGCVSLAAAVAKMEAAALQGGPAAATAPGAALGSETSAFLLGALSEGGDGGEFDGDDSEFDWKLGAPPPAPPEAGREAEAWAAARAVYCLLGQLYCLARQQLEVLGAAVGLEPPSFDADLAAVAAALPANDTAAAASPWATASASEAHSPRRSLQKVRSLSPTRISQDMGSMRGSFLSSGGGGGGPGSLSGVESGDEAASLSIKTRQESASLAQENLQTVDLSGAAGETEEVTPAGPLAAAALGLQPDGGPLEQEASKEGLSAAERGVEIAPVAAAGPGSPVPSLAAGLPRTRSEGSEPPRPSTAASTRASETDSAVSTPRTMGADAAATAAGAAAGPPIQDPGTSMRHIERALDSLMAVQAESGVHHHRRVSLAASAISTAPSLPLTPQDSLGSWEPGSTWSPVHWRLRRALESPAAFKNLWKELTVAAAAAFNAGGRRRQALLCGAEAAECLAAAGNMAAAAEALEAHCRTALEEGWLAIAASALPKLAACQAALGHPGLPHTAAALVSLAAADRGGAAFPPKSAKAAAALLARAAAQPSAALPLPPPLLPSHKASNGAFGGAFLAQIDMGTVDLSAALAAGPARGRHSRFFRQNDALGRPILLPTHSAGARSSNLEATKATPPLPSHSRCAVGDVAVVTLRVVNRLPATMQLSEVRLGLVGMQEITALASPRVSSPDPLYRLTMQSMPHQRGSRSSIGGSTPMQGPTPSAGRAGSIAVPPSPSPFYRTDSFADEGPRFTTEWKDTEDLVCCLLDATPGEGGALGAVTLSPPNTAPVALAPGVNTLRFVAAPVKRGLYRPVAVTAALGNLLISFDVARRVDNRSASGSGSGLMMASVSSGDSAGPYAGAETSVVLEVEPPQPRVEVAAASAGGGAALITGQRQWLGLRLSSTRDALNGATLAVTWPLPPAAAEIARKVSGLSGAAVAAAPPGGGAPVALGLSNVAAAALVAHGTDAEGGALLPAVPATGLGAWAADGTEEVTLPSVASETGASSGNGDADAGTEATVWWWVDAGPSVAAAAVATPEQVKVTAPGGISPALAAHTQSQMHSTSFFHSAGGPLAGSPPEEGLALDSAAAGAVPPPAASLELPLTLQYLSGCRRAFSTVLHLPLRLPFAVRAAARELPSGAILAHFHVTSLCPCPVTLSSASLEPQPGLALARDLCAELGLLPASALAPGAAFSFSFLLEVDRAMAAGDRAAAQLRMQTAAKLQPTALQLSYEIAAEDACCGEVSAASADAALPGGGLAASASGHRTTVHGEAGAGAGAGALPNTAAPPGLRLPPVAALRRLQEHSNAADALDAAPQSCVFTHRCCLELSPLGADIPGAVVLVQLLGPFHAVSGQPVSLCWRLERAGAAGDGPDGASAPAEPLRVRFELAADSDVWRPLGRRQGVVVLDPHDGAMATVEAAWVPAGTGALPVPTLSLADVAYQEVVDVGQKAGAEYIVVAPPQ